MREILLLTISILLSVENSDVVVPGRISEEYTAVSVHYRVAMSDAQAKGASRDDLIRIGKHRQEAFASLISTGLSDPDKMTASDWAALGMASEYLFQRNDCITYSFRAIEMEPGTKEAYSPLIRSLLNSNRMDEAEVVLKTAEKHVSDGTRWHDMHHILSVKYRKMEQWGKAALHCQTALDLVFRSEVLESIEIKEAARQVGVYRDISQKAGLEKECLSELTKWSRLCDDRLDRVSNDDHMSVKEFRYCAAVCELRCEFAKYLPYVKCDECLMQWAELVFHPRWTVCEGESTVQQMYFGKYLVANASKVACWGDISDVLSRIRNEYLTTMDGENVNASKSILSRLQDVADSHIAR